LALRRLRDGTVLTRGRPRRVAQLASLQRKLQEAEEAQKQLALDNAARAVAHAAEVAAATAAAEAAAADSFRNLPPPPPDTAALEAARARDAAAHAVELDALRAENAAMASNNGEVLSVLATLQARRRAVCVASSHAR
jgi:hypothetical protein